MKPQIVIILLVGAWTVACDSGSNVASTANIGLTAAEFAAQYCQIIEPCCADAGLSTRGDHCVNQVVGSATVGEQYNPVAAQDCLSATLAASKSSAFCSDYFGLLSLPQCNYLLGGEAVAPGESCTQSFECATAAGGGALCLMQTSGGSSTGSCVQTQTGMAGQGPCVATVVRGVLTSTRWSGPPPSTAYTCDVADGVSCNPTTHKCTVLAATGQPCQADEDCVTSAYCASGSCQRRVQVGAACGKTSAECVNTAYCDSFSSWLCKPLLPNGSACTGPWMCQSFNCDNGTCANVSAAPLAMACGP